jgi:hypothetical protein
MSSVSPLAYVQQCLTRYVLTTYVTFGIIGLLFNILIFSQPAHRRNSTSLYILAMSSCALVSVSVYIVPTIYTFNHLDPLTYSPFLCQIVYYLRHAFNQMMRTFFVLACADRYALSSNQARIRSFSQYRVTIWVIPLTMLFWFLLSIFPLMLRSLVNGVCGVRSGLSAVIYSIYGTIVTGILPLVCLVAFSILLTKNLKNLRRRVQPMSNTNTPVNPLLRKRDRDMLRMLLIEVICYTTTIGPLALVFVYQAATQTVMKSNYRLQIESFLLYFTTQFLLYITNSSSFWIYICASPSFRLEFKKFIIKCYEFIVRN